MQLWTDYEGVTIDGAFPLKKLLLPEGRSAFFSTTNSKGDSTFLRLIECHFDEEEILARWRSAEALGHPNFLRLERYGQLVMDGGTVVYSAFEKVDASLAEVLVQGRLSLSDTFQLAASLISALEMLHIHGFVHEHVEPRNIFAVGEVVKLRSDCIREAPEGEPGVDGKRRDVHDFALVLLQALTQKKTLDAAAKSQLPAPFDQIVQNGISGAWGLAEMQAALETGRRPSRSSSATAPPSARTSAHPSATPSVLLAGAAVRPANAAAMHLPPIVEGKACSSETPAPKMPYEAQTRPQSAAYAPLRPDFQAEDRKHEVSPKTGPRKTPRKSLGTGFGTSLGTNLGTGLGAKWLGAAAFVALLSLAAMWFFAHEGRGHRNSAVQSALSSAAHPAKITQLIGPRAPAPVRASLSAAATGSRTLPDHAAGARTQWRVIVYTYNHPDQARKKSATIAQKHPDLRPDVFTPSGHAPYLVTIGGVMTRDEAFALARKSRSAGLPRDTYAQNYNSVTP